MKRRNEDALRLFRPMDTQVPAITTRASEVLIRGGNRSGKSILGAAMVAAAARGKCLLDKDGNELPEIRIRTRPLLIWVIGKGEDHIGDTLYRLLFKPGQFPVFYDDNGELKAARNREELVRGESQGTIAGPFVPPDDIKNIAMSDAGAEVFNRCLLHNGTIICAFNSSGDVKMGDPVDLIWIDEDINYPQYVAEWQARLSDKKGRLIWTAWPWASNFALRQISRRADKQKDRPNPDVLEIKLSFLDNPFIDDDEKRKRLDGWSESGKSEVESRALGEWADSGTLMYPNFSTTVHGCPRDGVSHRDKLETFLAELNWMPPIHWTRYLTLDPGHSTTSIGIWASPPPDEFRNLRLRYDEIYVHGLDANQIALLLLPRVEGLEIEEIIIDVSLAKQTITGLGTTYLQLWEKAFEAVGIRSRTGGFTYSSSEVIPGVAAFRDWLAVQPDGGTIFRVVQANCQAFIREASMYRKQFAKDEAQDKAATGQADHAMDEARYGAMHGLEYRLPKLPQPKFGTAYQAYTTFWNKPKGPDDQALNVTIGVGTQDAA